MTSSVETRPNEGSGEVATKVVDLCAFHDWGNTHTLVPYLSDGWDVLLGRPTDPFGPGNTRVGTTYVDPRGFWDVEAYPESGVGTPGMDFETFKHQVLDTM